MAHQQTDTDLSDPSSPAIKPEPTDPSTLPPFNRPPQQCYGWFTDLPPPRGPYMWPCIPDNYTVHTDNDTPITDITSQPPVMCYGWYVPEPPPHRPYFWSALPPGYILAQPDAVLHCYNCYADAEHINYSCDRCGHIHRTDAYNRLLTHIQSIHDTAHPHTFKAELNQLLQQETDPSYTPQRLHHQHMEHTSVPQSQEYTTLTSIGAYSQANDGELLSSRTFSGFNPVASQSQQQTSPMPDLQFMSSQTSHVMPESQ